MDKKIKVGIIGVGAIANIAHLPILSKRDDIILIGCMAKRLESAKNAQHKYGIEKAVSSIEEMISLEPDCVFVLSPKQSHCEYVVRLLNANIDVFCEKPMGMTLSEASLMAETARKTGRKLMIGFNRRFAPVYQKAKEIYNVKAPDVIIAQKNRPATEYRATLENAIHMVDLMRFYCGECVSVEAHSKFTDPEYETLCTAQLKFENGTIGMLIADRASGQWEETLEMHGNNYSVYVNSPDLIKVTDNKQSHVTSLTPLAMGWAKVEEKLGFSNEDDHFLTCIKENKEPMTNGDDSYKTHLLMNQILKTAGLPGLE